MSDELSSLSTSSTTFIFKNHLSFHLIQCIFLHDFSLLCSFIFSHPLYFSYFIFFSPYLLKLLSFISPLCFTTALLLLSATPSTADFPLSQLGFLRIVIDKLQLESNHDDPLCDFEIIKFVFDDTSLIAIQLDEVSGGRRNDVTTSERDSPADKAEEEKSLDELFEELDRFEEFTTAQKSSNSGKVVGDLRNSVEKTGGSAAAVMNSSNYDKINQNSGKIEVVNCEKWRLNSNSSNNHRSHGSISKEKEWKNTLACKLFEERHNAGGGGEEGMDSLWETYDNSENQKEIMNTNTNKATMMIKNKSNKGMIKNFDDDDEEEEEKEEEFRNGQLCCLQALKFSSGKMNLGMKRSNLVKITKALKGFGWLHHVGSKHGKKRQGF